MMRTPKHNAPLERWLEQALFDNRKHLTVELVRWSLGNQAEHAFEFDGVELLIDFLKLHSERGPLEHAIIVEGVVELVHNLGLPAADRRYGGTERRALLRRQQEAAATQAGPATMQEAIDAAKHFYLLARASIERARFGGPERAADLACFETFRIASIAAITDDEVTSSERGLLDHITSWHHRAPNEAHVPLVEALAAGVELVSSSIASSAHHSLVLQIAATNTTVENRLRACAFELLDTTLRVDGLTKDEQLALETTLDQHPDEADLAQDLALVAKSIFILPGARGARLMPNPEFDRLWAVYRDAVPWSAANGDASL